MINGAASPQEPRCALSGQPEAKVEGHLGGRRSREADGKGSASQRWRVAGQAADVRLPVRVIQILPEARDGKGILEPLKNPASAGLTRLQALGPVGACVSQNKPFIVWTRNGPSVSPSRSHEGEGGSNPALQLRILGNAGGVHLRTGKSSFHPLLPTPIGHPRLALLGDVS